MKLPHIIWLRPQIVSSTTVRDLRTMFYGPDLPDTPEQAFNDLESAGEVASFVGRHLSGYFTLSSSGELTKITVIDSVTTTAAQRNIWWAVLDRDIRMFHRLATVAHYHRFRMGKNSSKKPSKKEIDAFKEVKAGHYLTTVTEDFAKLFIPVINKNTGKERSLRFVSVDEIKLRL